MTTTTVGNSGSRPYRTSDELAEDVLRCMVAIEATAGHARVTPDLRAAAHDLLRACLRLIDSGPPQYRVEVGRLLPLTQLEQDLLHAADPAGDPMAAEHVATRLAQWVGGGPIELGDRTVHVADFLERLWPSLGLWDDRIAVDAMIARKTGLAAAGP